MTGWLIFAVYLFGLLATWRYAFCWAIDEEKEDDRFTAGMMSLLPAMLWPVAVPFWLASKLITRPTPGERRKAQEDQLREELAEVRKLAREHGLPL